MIASGLSSVSDNKGMTNRFRGPLFLPFRPVFGAAVAGLPGVQGYGVRQGRFLRGGLRGYQSRALPLLSPSLPFPAPKLFQH